MAFLWLMKEWQNDGEFKKNGEELLLHFLSQKMKISNVKAINLILNDKKGIKSDLKRLLKLFEDSKLIKSPKNLKISSPKNLKTSSPLWIVRKNDPEYIGWTVFDAYNLTIFTNYNYQIPELIGVNTFRYSILKDIKYSLFFNIFNNFASFKYLNIGDVNNKDLVNGISQLLNLDNLQVHNYKSTNLINFKKKNYFSLITIFMNATHFKDPENIFAHIYDICENGGYLLVREYDLPSHQRDKAFLYETFYNLYKILFKEVEIDNFLKSFENDKEIIKNKYKTRHEWIEFISNFGFEPIAINIPYEINHYYDSVYLLFKKI